jgi:Xaa-Pro aminopeptidase
MSESSREVGLTAPESEAPVDEHQPPPQVEHRQQPSSPAFRKFIASGWAPRQDALPQRMPAAGYARQRRELLSAALPGERLVIPAGVLRTRSNDTDYRFRPHSAFAWLTGLGTDREPDAVLVLEPDGDQHEAVLFFRPRAERDSEEFYASPRYGELWVGVRPSLAEVEAETGLVCRHLDDLAEALAKDAGSIALRIVRGADAWVEEIVDDARASTAEDPGESQEEAGRMLADESGVIEEQSETADAELARILSELRLVKDDYEIAQMRLAIDITARGFGDIVRALPRAVAAVRGERVIETAFDSRARREGNAVGYDTIAASGPHACTLHWIVNDGAVNDGDLVLVDAGVEVDSLYTADVTRTMPVSGTFSRAQLEVYQAVLDAADAAFAAARPGTRFRDVHNAAMEVIAQRLHDWGLLPGTVEESLDQEGQFHRRWMVHGTSHHLGIDVHDCAQARREMYLDAELRPGMIFTIEPGLYFGPDDLLAPEAFRGMGVRIEDDVLVTADGCENLSAALPRQPVEIEAWMAALKN